MVSTIAGPVRKLESATAGRDLNRECTGAGKKAPEPKEPKAIKA
jgi:hypothetical protein